MKRSMLLVIGMFVLLGLVPQVWAAGGQPANIYKTDSIVIDGNLGDWANAEWTNLSVPYVPTPTFDNASFALAWSDTNNKIYIAARIKISSHYFLDHYVIGATSQDLLEIYVHTTGTWVTWPVTGSETNYGFSQAAAQSYVVSINPHNTSTAWASMSLSGYAKAIPSSAGFSAAGRESANGWVYYEAAVTPFDFYGGLFTKLPQGCSTVETNLAAGMSVGIDVIADDVDFGPDGAPVYQGMASENALAAKYTNFNNIATHTLSSTVLVVPSVTPPPDPTPSPTITPTPTPVVVVDGVITIVNPEFNLPSLASIPMPDRWINDTAAFWVPDGPVSLCADAGFGDPDGTNQAIQVNSPAGYVFQNTGRQMVEGMRYTLTFVSGNWEWASPEAHLYAGICAADTADNQTLGVQVAQVDVPWIGPGQNWTPHTLNYACDAANNGKYLVVKLGPDQDYSRYDNISVTYSALAHGSVVLADYDPLDPTIPVDLKIVVFDDEWNIFDTVVKQLHGLGGEFYIPTDLPAGNYNIALKTYGHLAKVVTITKVDNVISQLGLVELGAGDLHGDNECLFTSLSIVLKYMGSSGDYDPF